MQVCQNILDRLETKHDFLDRVITNDEPWIFEYDPETKHQSLQWRNPKSPRPKKARQSKVKLMLIYVHQYIRGVVHTEFLPLGQMIKHV